MPNGTFLGAFVGGRLRDVMARISQSRAPMDATMTLIPLSQKPEALRVHEAVAIAQVLLTGDPYNGEAAPPYGPLTPDSVALAPDGTVHCTGSAATPGTADVAILLQALLDACDDKVPGGLRYALGRALHEVEAPPFDSPSEFAATLARFELGSRQEVIAEACARLRDDAPVPHTSGLAPHGAERRRLGESHAQMRRSLREADLRLYESQRPSRLRHETAQRVLSHRMPMAACVIAGVVLMAAGDSASRGAATPGTVAESHRTQASDIALPAEPAAARTADIAVASSEPRPSAPAQTRVRVVPASSRRAAGRPRPSAVQVESSPRTRSRVSPPRKTAPRRDDDRGVIARIRFEWNNPFK